MKIAVDVRRVVQEIDLDSGETNNYLVFVIGETEHVVPATEEQLKRAIIEATTKQDNGGAASLQSFDNFTGEEMAAPPAAPPAYDVPNPTLGAVGEIPANTDFVQELLEEPLDEKEVSHAVMNTADPSVFEDVSRVLTDEDLAEYQVAGASTMPSKVNVVSDEEHGATFAEIMSSPGGDSRSDAPPSPVQQRKAAIAQKHQNGKPQGQREVIAALRARAKQLPPKRLGAHEVDEAGNPTVPQTKAPNPAPPGFAQYTDPNSPAVRVGTVPIPPGLAGLDDDGFEQG
jgi:hypothetical protein